MWWCFAKYECDVSHSHVYRWKKIDKHMFCVIPVKLWHCYHFGTFLNSKVDVNCENCPDWITRSLFHTKHFNILHVVFQTIWEKTKCLIAGIRHKHMQNPVFLPLHVAYLTISLCVMEFLAIWYVQYSQSTQKQRHEVDRKMIDMRSIAKCN